MELQLAKASAPILATELGILSVPAPFSATRSDWISGVGWGPRLWGGFLGLGKVGMASNLPDKSEPSKRAKHRRNKCGSQWSLSTGLKTMYTNVHKWVLLGF